MSKAPVAAPVILPGWVLADADAPRGVTVNEQTRWSNRALSASLALVLVISTAVAAVLPSGLDAAAASVSPDDVTLTIDDLPPGFVLDPQYTQDGFNDGIGPTRQVQYDADPSDPNSTGSLVIGQTVLRLDSGIGAGDALVSMRDFYIDHQSYQVSDAGPNDGGTFTLQKNDGGLDFVMIGFIKENWIFVTLAAGLPGAVTYDDVVQLAGISSARLDEKLGH
jgi:hypothetical protein